MVRFGHLWRRGRDRRREKREGLKQSWVLGSIKSVAGAQQIINYKSAAPTSMASLHFLKLKETSQWGGWVWVMYCRRWLCKQVEMGAADKRASHWAPLQEQGPGAGKRTLLCNQEISTMKLLSPLANINVHHGVAKTADIRTYRRETEAQNERMSSSNKTTGVAGTK